MTEAEILEQASNVGGQMWSVIQYWTSVSFAILVAGHFAADRLHWLVLLWFGILYMCFTVFVFDMVQYGAVTVRETLLQLQRMVDEGHQLSLMAISALEHAPIASQSPMIRIARLITFVGLFFTTLLYPVYCRFRARKLSD